MELDPNLLVTSPVAALGGAIIVKAYDWWKDGRNMRRKDATSASDAHAALNADLRASMKVLTEEVARLRLERDLETARLTATIARMREELADAQANSARKDSRIEELEREMSLLHRKVFGAQAVETDEPPTS